MDMSMDKYLKLGLRVRLHGLLCASSTCFFYFHMNGPFSMPVVRPSQPTGGSISLASQALKVVTDSLPLSRSLMAISSSPAMHKQLFFANQNE
jgi:hypothetical protein